MNHVYLLITRENKRSLREIPEFIWFDAYSSLDKNLFEGDIGKIIYPKCTFHFRYHNNIIIEKHEK